MTHARTIHRLVPLFGGLLLATGCPDDEGTPKLFDESGAWSLISYNLPGDGAPTEVDSMNRKDAFMLEFDPANSVVQTASCIDEGGGLVTPADSPCNLTPSTTAWSCQCFAYAFENERMKWREFDAGTMPPVVTFDDAGGDGSPPPADDGGSGGATGDDGGDESGGAPSGGDFNIAVAEVANVSATYTFVPLPTGVFGSNGTNSRFILQRRAPSLFDRAVEADPDGRATCEPCI
jgi:hypothetical protein